LCHLTVDSFSEQRVVSRGEESFKMSEHAAGLFAAAAQDTDLDTGLKDEIERGGEGAEGGFAPAAIGEEDGVAGTMGAEVGGVLGGEGRSCEGKTYVARVWFLGVITKEGAADVIKGRGVTGEHCCSREVEGEMREDPGVKLIWG